MKSKNKTNPSTRAFSKISNFFKKNWIGTLVIVLFTVIFFWPLLTRISSYSEGGDAMFNAWTLARNQHCILRQNCPSYVNGNIYAPNKNTMLYSETQISAGLLTLPLYFINSNPLFSYNVWSILSMFFSAWFMYLLAKRLSKGNELVSITAGLVFGYAPIKITALSHLQNLSIFYLPLIVLSIIAFIETSKKRFLLTTFITCALLFNSSWYQMAFVLIALSVMLIMYKIFKLISIKNLIIIGSVIGLSVLTTAPLAIKYSQFSKDNSAKYTLLDTVYYSSSVADYFIPGSQTVTKSVYNKVSPSSQLNRYNPDSSSYHGVFLYIATLLIIVGAIVILIKKKQRGKNLESKQVIVWAVVAITGFVFSLGPLIKVFGSYYYGSGVDGIKLAMPAPWLIIYKLLPQIAFIRSIGRISIIMLFGLLCILALSPQIVTRFLKSTTKIRYITIIACSLILIELMPVSQFHMSSRVDAYDLTVPQVYKFIAKQDEIDNIVIIRDKQERLNNNFPFNRTEDVLWAGYHNKNIFNGYSGYEPKQYAKQYSDFVHFDSDDVQDMNKLGMNYLLVDSRYKTRQHPTAKVSQVLGKPIYKDRFYKLYKLP